MIADSVAYLKAAGREVIFDAEHFFDGWKADPEYTLKTIQAAAQAGAGLIVLCDTNGGSDARGNRRDHPGRRRRLARAGGHSHATTTAIWPWPIRWPPSMPARCRFKEPSTVSANAAAMPT